jgi:hypothetical protein
MRTQSNISILNLQPVEDRLTTIKRDGFENRSRSTARAASPAPIFDPKPGDANHMNEVGRDEGRIDSQRMRRDRGVEFLDPGSATFEGCLDATVRVADIIGPLGLWELSTQQIEARTSTFMYEPSPHRAQIEH